MKVEYTVEVTMEKAGYSAKINVVVIYHGSHSQWDIWESAKELLEEGETNVLDSEHVIKGSDGYVDRYRLTGDGDAVEIPIDRAERYITDLRIVKKGA